MPANSAMLWCTHTFENKTKTTKRLINGLSFFVSVVCNHLLSHKQNLITLAMMLVSLSGD